MATLLQTKPGINGANILSIPKDWDAAWFRKLIANSLKGADVRNAISGPGIQITGNISSPYATIGVGGSVPATVGPPSPAGFAFKVVGNSGVPFLGNTHLGLQIAGATGTTDYSGIDFSSTNTNPQARIAAVFAGGGSSLVFGTSNNYTTGITNTALTIDPSGTLIIAKPATAGLHALLVNINPGEAITVTNAAGGTGGAFISWRSVAAEVGFMGNGTSIGGANGNDFGIGSDSGNIILNSATGIKGFGGAVSVTAVDMTPDSGTFTLTGTGFTAAVTSTATWYRIGRVVVLNVGNGMQGTSNATTFTMTGLPSALQPSVVGSQTQACADMENNSLAVFGNAAFNSGSGTITMGNGANAGALWTNAGSKGFFNSGGTTIVYSL